MGIRGKVEQKKGYQRGTWHVHRKIYNREKDLAEDYMEKGEDKLYREQEIKIKGKDIKTEKTSIGEQRLDQNQQQQTEKLEGENIRFISIVEDLGIQLKIVGVKDKKLGREEELNKMSYQKRIEVSKLPATLL